MKDDKKRLMLEDFKQKKNDLEKDAEQLERVTGGQNYGPPIPECVVCNAFCDFE